jgi:hypothetical protein
MFLFLTHIIGSVGIATGYGLDGQEKKYFSIHSVQTGLGPTQPPIQWIPGASQGVKLQGREADHSPPSSAEVNNGESIPPLPHTSSWHGITS